MSGIAGGIAQGMMFGTGSAIGHRAVGAVADSMSGGGDQEMAPAGSQPMSTQAGQVQGGACALEKGNYFDCLKSTGDAQACQFLFQTLQSCQQGGAGGAMSTSSDEKQWS